MTAPDTQPGSARTSALLAALRAHYLPPGELMPGGVLLTEVPAPDAARRADAVYVRFTRSRGYCIDAHELKISRADWRRELTDPGKAEAWWPYCTRWWIVAPDPSIVPVDELPDGWGLMCPPRRGRRFRVVAQARAKKPTITLDLLVELMKKLDTARIDAVVDERRRADQHADELRRQTHLTLAPAGVPEQGRLTLLDELETAANVRLVAHPRHAGQASPAHLAALLRPLLAADRADNHLDRQIRGLAEHAAAARRALDQLDTALRDATRRRATDS